MKKKLTITIEEKVYNDLYLTIGKRKISKFIEKIIKPYVTINNKKTKAMADQIMTVSKKRLKSKLGIILDNEMQLVEKAIKIQLLLN